MTLKKLTVVALSLLAAGAAMAEGLSREQVVAELVRARQSGELQAMQSENPDAFGRAQIALGGKSATALAANTKAAEAAASAGNKAQPTKAQ